MLIPLTTYRVLEYMDDFVSGVRESLNRAGIKSRIYCLNNIVNITMKCFDWNRRQYLASCAIDQISNIFKEYIDANRYVIGIGYLDGYEHGLNFVFGEADPKSSTAMVFTKRLDPLFYGLPSDYNLYVKRVIKEIIHELGHLLGLEHCSSRECVMSFSNSVLEVDAKSMFFCNTCSAKLKTLYI